MTLRAITHAACSILLMTQLLPPARAADTWEVTPSADLRLRGEIWDNFGFDPSQDDEYLQSRIRVRAHVKVPYHGIGILVEGKSSLTTDRDLPGGNRTLDEDPLDLQQAYIRLPGPELGDVTTTALLGRQALKYGSQRLVSPLAWSNTGRAWDGARLIARTGDWQLDAFFTQFVPVDKYDFNDPDSDHPFYGFYTTHQAESWLHQFDVYVLRDERDTADRSTFGTLLKAAVEELSGEVEAAYQDGDTGDLDIDAWMVATTASYAVPHCPVSSVWSLGFDVSSGDRDPDDDESNTFHPLFPLGHAFHGYIDALGRRNLTDFYQSVSLKPVDKVTVRLAYHFFERTENEDAVYNAGNGVLRAADSSTRSDIGNELDITVKYAIHPSATLEAGYGRLFAGDVIDDGTPDADDIQFGYLSALVTF